MNIAAAAAAAAYIPLSAAAGACQLVFVTVESRLVFSYDIWKLVNYATTIPARTTPDLFMFHI